MPTKNTAIISARADKEMIARVDKLAEVSGLTRSEYLKTLLLRELLKARPVGIAGKEEYRVDEVSTLPGRKSVDRLSTPSTLVVDKVSTTREVSVMAERNKGTPWGWILLGVLVVLTLSQGPGELGQAGPGPVQRLGR